jgi:3-oxoadipate enol-lactonase
MSKSLSKLSLNVVKEGSGPIVILSHALGCNLRMWDDVAPILKNDFTVVRYDHRNHGQSGFVSKKFSIDDLADDAAMLIEGLGNGPVFFVGLSLGGMVAQSLAARYPKLVRACVIANSSQHYEDSIKRMWSDRINKVREGGVSAISGAAIERWFTPEYLLSENESSKRKIIYIKRELDELDAHAYSLSCDAVA